MGEAIKFVAISTKLFSPLICLNLMKEIKKEVMKDEK